MIRRIEAGCERQDCLCDTAADVEQMLVAAACLAYRLAFLRKLGRESAEPRPNSPA
jgi:hypothetical protein